MCAFFLEGIRNILIFLNFYYRFWSHKGTSCEICLSQQNSYSTNAFEVMVRPQRNEFLGMLQGECGAEQRAVLVNCSLLTSQSFWWLERVVLGTNSLVILSF